MKNQCTKVLFLASIATMAMAATVFKIDMVASSDETPIKDDVTKPKDYEESSWSEEDPSRGNYTDVEETEAWRDEKRPEDNEERSWSEEEPPGGNNTDVEEKETSGIRLMKFIHSSCLDNTGSNDTFDQLLITADRSIACANGTMSLNAFTSEINGLDDESKREEFFSRYCPQLQSLESCITPVTIELQKCLNEPELNLINSLVSLHSEGIKVACRDNGKMIFDFYTACKHLKDNSEDVATFSPQECDELGELRQCYLDQLQQSNLSRMIEFLDLYIWQDVKKSPCKDIPITDFALERYLGS